MDDLIVALVSGLLGGGVAGALIGAYLGLSQQRRAFAHERETRFLDLRRERYADLLRLADAWGREVSHQRDVAQSVREGRGTTADIPTLRPTTDIEQTAVEVDLLGSREVGRAAIRLLTACIALGSYAYDAEREGQLRMEHVVSWNEVIVGFTAERNTFRDAAKVDLGTA